MLRPPIVRGTTIAALLVASLAHTLGSTGRASAEDGVAADALAPGAWSVQFSVQPNFTLGSYLGSTLSLKRHLASGNALRFGLSVGIGNTSDDYTDILADTFATRTQSSPVDGRQWSIGVAGYYLWYSGRAAPVHAYWGAGPTFSVSRNHVERAQSFTFVSPGQPTFTAMSVEDIRDRVWQVGVTGAIGVEWLVARRVGLFAEYGSSLAYTSRHFTRQSTSSSSQIPSPTTGFTDTDSHRWDFTGSGGRLGISAYF